MLRLKAWGVEEVVVFWDKKDAKNEIIRAIPELQMHFKRVYVSRMRTWPSNKDPGNMLAELQGAEVGHGPGRHGRAAIIRRRTQ